MVFDINFNHTNQIVLLTWFKNNTAQQNFKTYQHKSVVESIVGNYIFFRKICFFRFNFFTPKFKDMTLRSSQITGRREQGG